MAEISFWWNTSDPPVGDGKVSYTQADLSTIAAVLAACCGWEGVAPAYLNELVPAAAGANTVSIGTGGALVDGKPYQSNTLVNVNVPSASGGGNTRIDRIVLRATWGVTQTVRIFRIAGTDAGAPTVPLIETTPGTLYDIHICQVLVDTAGAVTVTDERDWAATSACGLQANAVTTVKIRDAVVVTAKIANDAVSDTKLRNSGALSVIGRASNSAGDPGDIVAAADGQVLRRSGTAVGFGTVISAGIADGAVTAAKVAADVATQAELDTHTAATTGIHGAVSSGLVANKIIIRDALGRAQVTAPAVAEDIARKDTVDAVQGNLNTHKTAALLDHPDNSVDDTKVGNRVPQFYRRQGGHGTNWDVDGETNYSPGAVRMQGGVRITGAQGYVDITLPVPFSGVPLVFPSSELAVNIRVLLRTSSGFRLQATDSEGTLVSGAKLFWLAIGPE